ncbi:hypothetical protein ACFL4N_03845 [Thermodesulfobacteriota bacterium]
MSLEISRAVLERACREMIETILLCLPDAYKGTIYRIGKPPELIAERITSGIIDRKEMAISWGLPSQSDYNPPGKPWLAYRDEQGRVFEAMAWCVETQKSWTSEDPANDPRNARGIVDGEVPDYHHMEPVLVKRSDLSLNMHSSVEYPRNTEGNMIWEKSDYVVVAVIKIHFQPQTINIGSPEAKVIKKLSRSLGTQLLSYQLRQDSLNVVQQIAKDRLNACDILADSLRNAITKSGLVFSLIKQEIGFLREQWEQMLRDRRNGKNTKVEAIEKLNGLLRGMNGEHGALSKDLIEVQKRFLTLHLPPDKGKNWVALQIEERWKELLVDSAISPGEQEEVRQTLDLLKKSLGFGREPEVVAQYDRISQDVKEEWVRLIYRENDHFDPSDIEKIINILMHSGIEIPSHIKSGKTLAQLMALGETVKQLEQNTNFLLRQVLNGGTHRGDLGNSQGDPEAMESGDGVYELPFGVGDGNS